MSPQGETLSRRRELALRVASAAVLIPFGLYAVWTGGWALAVGAAIVGAAMAFEWGRMTQGGVVMAAIVFSALINAVYPVTPQYSAYALAGAAVIGALAARGSERRGAAAFGIVYTAGMPLALQALRAWPGEGWALALGSMLIVWASDSGAYFAGRALGGPLIAPQDSPNKTWSGAAGGALAAIAAGAAFAALINASIPAWTLWGFFITLAAQGGDMFESQIKRRYGVKDASGLVPGHGGVLDRVDGLGAACVAAIALLSIWPSASASLGGGA